MGEIKRFDWFWDQHFGVGIRWSDLDFPFHLVISLPFVTFNIGIGTYKTQEVQMSITDIPVLCPKCGWIGTVWDCECDVDNDGSLGCPKCLTVVEELVSG